MWVEAQTAGGVKLTKPHVTKHNTRDGRGGAMHGTCQGCPFHLTKRPHSYGCTFMQSLRLQHIETATALPLRCDMLEDATILSHGNVEYIKRTTTMATRIVTYANATKKQKAFICHCSHFDFISFFFWHHGRTSINKHAASRHARWWVFPHSRNGPQQVAVIFPASTIARI